MSALQAASERGKDKPDENSKIKMKKIFLNLCVMLIAVITVPIAVTLYIPYALFKVLSDKDEFRDFYGGMMDILIVPFMRYRAKMREYDKTR